MNFMDSTMLLVGTAPQYFFDNVVMEQIQDLTKVFHSPAKDPEPVLQKDRPWEHVPYFTVCGWSVVRDSQSGEFKCWYEDWQINPQGTHAEGAAPDRPTLEITPSRMCYARSDDGQTWQKPALDYSVEDGKKTNVVFGNPSHLRAESSTVIEDLLESDPAKRFKTFYGHIAPAGYVVSIAHSPDGIRWTPSNPPEFGHLGTGLGDVYMVFQDLESHAYRLTGRHQGILTVHHDARRPQTPCVFFHPTYPRDASRANKRRVFQATSTDLVHFSSPHCIITPDEDIENLDETFYGMAQIRMGQGYLGFLNTLHEVSNTMNVRLVHSRDGWSWHHLNHRQPWLTTSEDSWDRNMVNISSPPIRVDDELYVFHGGARNHHDWWISGLQEELDVPEAFTLDEVGYGLGLARLRPDGFVSLDAGPVREGVMVTRALRTSGKQLVLNADCGTGGCIRIEATDADENVLGGCALDRFDTYTGDSLNAVMTWQGKPDIPHSGCLRLRFFMRNASLYSFAFA